MTDSLWRVVREAQAHDIMAPVTIVGPTRYANLALRHELGSHGFVNVRFIIMSQLSELLGAGRLGTSRPGESSPDPLTEVIRAVSIRQVLQRNSTSLSPVSNHPATRSRILSCFRELRSADEGVLNALEKQDGIPADVVRLYRAFRRRTSLRWYDEEDLALAAVDALRSEGSPALSDLGLIIFYLPRKLSPSEALLIRTLLEQGKCTVVLGQHQDDDNDEQVGSLVRTLTTSNSSPGIVIPSDPLFGITETHVYVAPTAREEIRHVIRGIMAEAKRNRTPFRRMAVLYRTREPYASLIPYELTEAGIPIAGPGTGLLRDTAPGRTLMGLLDLADAEFPRARVMAWLTGCPVRPKDAPVEFNPSAWDSLTRRAGIVAGRAQWQSRLYHYAKEASEKADSLLASGEITETHSDLIKRDAEDAKALLDFYNGLATNLVPPEDGSKWQRFSDWGCRLLDYYFGEQVPSDEVASLEKVQDALEELKAADDIEAGATLAEFKQTLDHELQNSTGRLGDMGRGVFVSSFGAAAGLTFDAIWMVGLIEGAVPPATPPDPLLPESDWQRAGGSSRTKQRISEERHDFLSALASAHSRVLSYPEAGTSSGRRAYPSRWLLEQASKLADVRIQSDTLHRFASEAWLTIHPSPESAIRAIHADESLADLHDYTLHRLLSWQRDGNRLHNHPFAQNGILARATRLQAKRQLSVLTEFDGNLSAIADDAKFSRSLATNSISPTRLEGWARCPFSYFLAHILRLSALDTPEDILSIGAIDRGSLIHTIFERFIRESGIPPAHGQPWPSESRSLLFEIAQNEFTKAEQRGVTGKPLLWALAMDEILSDLDTFLEEDSKLRQEHGSTSISAETSFGRGASSLPVSDPLTQIRFHGQIDRIDLAENGNSILVTDYKTGGSSYFSNLNEDPIDRGKHLQLGVYSLAAHALFPDAERILAAYWFPTSRGGFKRLPDPPFDIGDSQTIGRFREGVSTIASGIMAGVFPANPGPRDPYKSNCTFCDFDAICPSRRSDLWDLKKNDPIVSDYVELAEKDEGPQ